MKQLLLFLLVGVFAAPHAWSQMDGGWLPAGINGEVGSMAFSGEAEKTNQLSAGVTAGSAYADNGSSNTGDRVGYFSYTISPSVSILETRPRFSLMVYYTPGFNWDHLGGNRYLHNLYFNSQYRLAERLTLQVGDGFRRTTTTFTRLNKNPLLPVGNLLQQQNDSIITPETYFTANQAHLDLVYQPSEATTIGVGGSFNELMFANNASGNDVRLLNSNSGSADAYYERRVWSRSRLGITYMFSRVVTSGQVHEGADSQSVLFRYTFAPSRHTSLSLFGGPRRSTTMDQLVLQIGPFPIPLSVKSERWGVDGGMTAGWQGQRNSVRASFMRRVTDGGGLTGAVHSNFGNLELRRQLSERWTGNAEVTYAANDALSLAYGNSFRTLRAIGGLNYDLRKDLSIALNYSRDHQRRRAVAVSPTSGITDYDRIWFSVSYHFTRPLGW